MYVPMPVSVSVSTGHLQPYSFFRQLDAMRSSSIPCSTIPVHRSRYFSASRFAALPRKWWDSAPKSSSRRRFPLISSQIRPRSCSNFRATDTQKFVETIDDIVETTSSASGFVETGYIYGTHGLKGEVRVKPSTDFSDLRFSKPGMRWLKQQASGTETLQEIELVEGRGHGGQNWIVKFNNINTVEQAQKLVGSTILVTNQDRPVLEDGEFYTNDLIGMDVVLKESGELVGTVVNVFNSGASDLLHVKLNMLRNISDQIGKSKAGQESSGPLVWIPFVEAIVPAVDLEKREMLITPPKGLLELNVRSHERTKKERRELEWKERKRFQRRLIAAKKILSEMEQQHVFFGFRHGQKDKGKLLADQIVTVNSKLLQQALKNTEISLARPDLFHILSAVPRSYMIRVPVDVSSAGGGNLAELYCKLLWEGQNLNSNGKVAICLVLQEIEEIENCSHPANTDENENAQMVVKTLLDDHARFIRVKDRPSVPLLLVCSAESISSIQELFSNHDYFGFDPEKVWFLEEEKLPVVSSTSEGPGKKKILMKSPWEFLQKSIGSGGVISLLSSQEPLMDQLNEVGVEYIEVCTINRKHEHSNALLGLARSCQANVGIHLFNGITMEEFDVILSTSFLMKLIKQINKLQFHAVLARNSYVEMVEKEWVDVNPSTPNSYEFRASIYSCLNACPMNKVCVLDSTT